MKQFIQNHLTIFDRSVSYPRTYREELNYQASRIIFLCGLICIFAWIPYISFDAVLNPDIQAMYFLRIGLSLAGFLTLILSLVPAIRAEYSLHILIVLGTYLLIATGIITGLSGGNAAYIGGFLFILMLIPLVPLPKKAAWIILAAAVSAFFMTGLILGVNFRTPMERYSLNDLLTTTLICGIFIYVTDRIRYRNWSASLKVQDQNEEIAHIHGKTIESITYTKRIQESFLPPCSRINRHFGDFLVIWQPKDIVGGDIYYLNVYGGKTYLCLLDCTGHGVPGAFLTTVTLAILEQILSEQPGIAVGEVFSRLNTRLQQRLHEDARDHKSSDGADGVLLCFDPARPGGFSYAGANIGIYYPEHGKYHIVKGDKHSLGCKRTHRDTVFSEHWIKQEAGQRYFLATDGYRDQSGGQHGYSLGRRRFMEILNLTIGMSSENARELLETSLKEYQGSFSQRDDITILGFI
ncbi:SpoIIE family protein phosphatase [Spirochaeta dissipatitropha]